MKIEGSNRIVQTHMQEGTEGGERVLTYWYDEVNAKGVLVRQHVLTELMPTVNPGESWLVG